MALSGDGNVQDLTLDIISHSWIFLTAVILTVSLAEDAWLLKDRNAIVDRIARITIVIISSVRVKAELGFRVREGVFGKVFFEWNIEVGIKE